MAYITAAVLAGTAIYSAIDASNRRKKAKDAIEKLKGFNPKYRSAKDIQTEAEVTIQEGYSPAEVAAFNQSMARGNTAAYQRAVQTNPNLANQVQAGLNYGNIGARVRFAADDAQLRRAKIRDYASMIQGQSNRQVSNDLAYKREAELQAGAAKAEANAQIYNSIMQLGYAGASAAKVNNGSGYTPTTTPDGGLTSTSGLGGQAPLQTLQNPQIGSDTWAQSLYRTPDQQSNFRMNNLQFQSPYQRQSMLLAQPSAAPYQQPYPYNQSVWMSDPNAFNPRRY